MAAYRIVTDNFAGYEVQVRRWWWPFWIQADFVNTHRTVAEAEKWAARHAQGTVKYLGRYTPEEPEQPRRAATVLRLVPRASADHSEGAGQP